MRATAAKSNQGIMKRELAFFTETYQLPVWAPQEFVSAESQLFEDPYQNSHELIVSEYLNPPDTYS